MLVQEEKGIRNGPGGGSAVKRNSTFTVLRGGESPTAGGEESLQTELQKHKSCSPRQVWQSAACQQLGLGAYW